MESITQEELEKTIQSTNRGTAADYYSLTTENIIYGGPILCRTILNVLNAILKSEKFLNVLKLVY